MAVVHYDFAAATNGDGSPGSPRNTWATPGNGDVIRIKRGNRWVRASQVNFLTATDVTVEAWANADGSDDPSLPKPIINHTAASTFVWNFVGDGVHRIRNLRFENCTSNTNGAVIGAGTVAATGNGAQLDVRFCEFHGISHNAIRMSATGANASPTFKALFNIFRNIGEDCVYGGALDYEFGHNDCRRISTNTETGDAVGFLGAVPTLAWVHHNYIDHGNDYKHCIIIDTSTTDSGLGLIEDNVLIGFGGESTGANTHTVINGDARLIVRRNRIYSAGIALNLAGNASEAYMNEIIVRNIQASAPSIVALQCSSATVTNNTIYAMRLVAGRGVVQAAGESGNVVRNNLFANLAQGVRTDGGTAPTVSNNAMDGVTDPYVGGGLAAVDDVASSLMVTANYRPLPGSPLLTQGADLGPRRDIRGHQSRRFVGAFGAARMLRAR